MRLWKRFGGEPFMVNPHLGILGAVNPKEKGSTTMARARKSGRAHMAWVRSFKKNKSHRVHHRRRAKRNPWPIAGIVANPHRRRRYKRNPSRISTSIGGLFKLPPLQSVLYVGAGLVGTPVLESYVVGWLPVAITGNTVGRYAVKIATVLGLSFLASKTVGREQAKMVAIGGGAYVLVSAVKEFFPTLLPAGVHSYTPTLGAYTKQLGAPAWGARNTTQSAGDGGANIVSARFRRFQ